MYMNQGGHNCFRLSQVKDWNPVLEAADLENIHVIHVLLHSHLEWVILVNAKGNVTRSSYIIDLF